MYSIEIPEGLKQIFTIFYGLRLWDFEEKHYFYRFGLKLFHFLYYLMFSLSLAVGACVTNDKDELVMLTVASIIAAVHVFRLAYIIWRQNKIISLISQLTAHSTNDRDEFIQVKKKLEYVAKIAKGFMFLCCSGIPLISIHPILSSKKLLIVNIAFPLDWTKSSTEFWITHAYIVLGSTYGLLCNLLSIIIWYLMLNSAVKYEMLGNRLGMMGVILKCGAEAQKVSITAKEKSFLKDLVEAIKSHQNINDTIDEFSSTFSILFFIQLFTSSIGICGSVYILAFSSHENLTRDGLYCIMLLYNLFDILVIMYFGNEIKLSSDRMSYCLFKSNWTQHVPASNKYIIILTEVVKTPKELIIGKLYPLNLRTFTSIVNSAYSLFNILQNLRN